MLENKLNLEKKSDDKEIDLGRIGYTTLGYGILGALYPNPEIVAPLASMIGLGASTYDELKDKNINLATPAIGAFTGGLIGYLLNSPELAQQLPHITLYAGSLIGGGLSVYKSFKERKKVL